jgi:hypothetical protein
MIYIGKCGQGPDCVENTYSKRKQYNTCTSNNKTCIFDKISILFIHLLRYYKTFPVFMRKYKFTYDQKP